jgi:hypothetical protein
MIKLVISHEWKSSRQSVGRRARVIKGEFFPHKYSLGTDVILHISFNSASFPFLLVL